MARRTHDGDEVTTVDFQRDPLQRGERNLSRPICLNQIFDFDCDFSHETLWKQRATFPPGRPELQAGTKDINDGCYEAVTRLDFHPVENFTRSDWTQEQSWWWSALRIPPRHQEFFAPGISALFSELSARGDV
jgi:hypothetical protein